jgi:hypothetical protein
MRLLNGCPHPILSQAHTTHDAQFAPWAPCRKLHLAVLPVMQYNGNNEKSPVLLQQPGHSQDDGGDLAVVSVA